MLVSLATLTSAMVVELFPSGSSLASCKHVCRSISSYRTVSGRPVDIHKGASLLQDVVGSPGVSGDVFVTGILLVTGENSLVTMQ